MGLKETANTMLKLLEECTQNLQKSASGNKAAAQRVRTGTIKLEKVAKLYRKESVAAERKGGAAKRPTKTPAKAKTPVKKVVKKVKKKK